MIPGWVHELVIYQIFPDRFFNGNPDNDPPNVQRWGAKPTLWEFQGGDLEGVIRKLDYLQSLGINAIYLNPIFHASSVHRYNTFDYYRIDPKLGTMDDFHRLLDEAHARSMYVILDGVFNHCGRGFFAFVDVLENQEYSAYKDWFHIHNFPLDACGEGQAKHYDAWWSFKSLPKFNTDNPDVRTYLWDVGEYWIRQGADGWRLDVPNEIDDDAFWKTFRDRVKRANPEAFLIGEIWTADPRWIGPDHFDSLMNYPFRTAVIDHLALGTLSPSAFMDTLENLYGLYTLEENISHFLLLGSHDTERIRTVCDGRIDLVKLAQLIQFSYPGIPSIYYGDEIGLRGGKDPACRAGFPWDESIWDPSLQDHVRSLVQLRNTLPPLRYGAFKGIASDDSRGISAFARLHEGSAALTALNVSGKTQRAVLPMDRIGWTSRTPIGCYPTGVELIVSDGHILVDLPPTSGVLIYQKDG